MKLSKPRERMVPTFAGLIMSGALWAWGSGAVMAQTCLTPPADAAIGGDSESDAARPETTFRRIGSAGVTDVIDGTNAFVLADFDRDNRVDILLVQDGGIRGGATPRSGRLRLMLNRGCFRFEEHPVTVGDKVLASQGFGRSPQIANVADFNRDGYLDIFVGRQRNGQRADPVANTLLISQGAFDRFQDVGAEMGIGNQDSYNRQSAIGDLDQDGWLDLAVGADMIGHPGVAGIPRHRVYLYQPGSGGFETGKFVDVSTSGLLPDFPGEYVCDPRRDRAGPGILFRDLDADGDLDVIQAYHTDNTQGRPDFPCHAGVLKTGVWTWRNQLRESGAFEFEKAVENGLAEEGQAKFDAEQKRYVPVESAISLPYLFSADIDNDGLQDVLAVGPTDASWTVKTDPSAVKVWRNLGNFRFETVTSTTGLGVLDWSYHEWMKAFGVTVSDEFDRRDRICEAYAAAFVPQCDGRTSLDNKMYLADAVFGDFDNDGDLDLIVADRHDGPQTLGVLRNVLFLNNGKGEFTLQSTETSGIDRNSIAMEAADLNGDGLLDLYFAMDPENSYATTRDTRNQTPLAPASYRDAIYFNTGAGDAAKNHWLIARFSGIDSAKLIGARIEAFAQNGKRLGMRELSGSPSYKSGVDLWAHFGLGGETAASLKLTLLTGEIREFPELKADQNYVLDWAKGIAGTVR